MAKENASKRICLMFLGLILGGVASCSKNDASAPPAPTTQSSKDSPSASLPPLNAPQDGLKSRQAAYKAWRITFDANINQFDDHWADWKRIFGSITNGDGNRYTVYSDLKSLSNRMDSFKNSLMENRAPESLGVKNSKDLNDAYAGLSVTTGKRIEAIRMAMEMFDSGDFRPSATERVTSTIKDSDLMLLVTWTKVYSVEGDLGLFDDKPAKRKKAKATEM